MVREWLDIPTPAPAEDYGFFGPDSITWKVCSYPTGLSIGFQRAVVIEELDPGLVAAVDKTHDIYQRPRTRYDRTLRYFAMVAFDGSAATATVTLPLKLSYRAPARSTRLQLLLLKLLSPNTVEVAGRALLGIAPLDPVTTSPQAAQTRLGFDTPREAHRELRAKQHARVFGEGIAPSDEGLIESQPILGAVR